MKYLEEILWVGFGIYMIWLIERLLNHVFGG
jgi:hypothetical protein